MREDREIEQAAAFRNEEKADVLSLATFERDFRGGSWFHEHPKVRPVSQIYFYDFREKQNKAHR